MPKLLKTPFAVDAAEGFRTDIQESTGAAPNSATYQVGFPPITMQSIASSGMPPKGSDLNGVLYDITDNLVFLTQGGGYGFDPAYAASIGGYPLNARLHLANGDIVKSTINGNTNNPNVNMAGWKTALNYITPSAFGAKGDGVTDDSEALTKTLLFACANNIFVDGESKTYACHSVKFDNNTVFKNAKLVCNKFDQDLVSVLECSSYSDDPRWLENVYFENIHIDGKRQLHTGIKDTSLMEDGGRSGFRVIRPVNGFRMVGCSGNNCAADGFIIFPHGYTKGNGYVLNVHLTDCEFNGNRRHGGSSNSVDGMIFERVTCNNNGLDIDDTAPLNSGLRGDRTPVGLYGSGWDCEEYLAGTVSTNMRFIDCEMINNAKMGFLALLPPEIAEYPIKANIYFEGGRYNRGLAPTAEEMSILLSPNGTPDIQMFNVVSFKNVDAMGAAISLRSTSHGYFENIINGFVHALQYTSVTVLGDFVALALTSTSKVNRVLAPDQDTFSISETDISLNSEIVNIRNDEASSGDSEIRGHSNNALGSKFKISHQVNGTDRGSLRFNLTDFGGSALTYAFNGIDICGFTQYGIYASGDGVSQIGKSGYRFKDIYLVNSPNVSSDARLKKDIRTLSETEKLVAAELKKNIKIYQLIGSDESLHIGIVAQEVVAIFDKYGLNAHDYSLIHYEDDRYSVRYAQLNLFLHSVV